MGDSSSVSEIARSFSHTSTVSVDGYGYAAVSDELKRTATLTSAVRTAITATTESHEALAPKTVTRKRLQKLQLEPNTKLIGCLAACTEGNCSAQHEHCMECKSFTPDPAFIPEAIKTCNLLTERKEMLLQSGNTEFLDLTEAQLAVYQNFLLLTSTLK